MKFPAAIPGQFIILDAADAKRLEAHPLRTGWNAHEIESLTILAAPDVQLLRCRLGSGRTVGFFLGQPADVETRRLIADDQLFADPPAENDQIDRWVEEQVYRFAGRFVFVLTLGGMKRAYVDADGFLPLVYDPALRACGSTAAALYGPDEFLSRFDAELFERMNLFAGGWFPAGLTAHRGLKRLMCNFYLDLADWTTWRHWPTGDLPYADEPLKAIGELGDVIRKGIATYLEAGPACMALTGGNESRLLLSLARDWASSIQFVCWYDKKGSRDRVISERLAAMFGLNVRFLQFPGVSEDEANEWMARTGYCAAENRYRYKITGLLDEFDRMIGGLGGEIGRGFFWRGGDGDRPMTAADIYRRLALPSHPDAEAAVAAWFRTLPTSEPLLQLDLAYLEVRMSCWATVSAYATIGPTQFYPMVSRDVYTRMLTLPPEWRRDTRWFKAVIGSNWPELLCVPINNLGFVMEMLRSLARTVRQPSLVVRRWKRRFG